MTNPPLSYKDAGVDIDAGDALVERIKPLAKKTMRDGVLAGIGGFGALFEVPRRYKEPVLVSGTDGVGTKLKLAFEWNMHDTVFYLPAGEWRNLLTEEISTQAGWRTEKHSYLSLPLWVNVTQATDWPCLEGYS